MPLWNDPYDELISELERAVSPEPPGPGPWDDLLDTKTFQEISVIILYGSDQERQQLSTNPQYRDYIARLKNLTGPARASSGSVQR